MWYSTGLVYLTKVVPSSVRAPYCLVGFCLVTVRYGGLNYYKMQLCYGKIKFAKLASVTV